MKERERNKVYLFLLAAIVSIVKGQHVIKNVTFSDTLFSSPGYVDSLNYGINATRDYRFSTYPNYTMVFTVVEFVLESASKQSDCLYDKVTLYDGYDNTAPVLNVLCGTITPGTTYTTTGDTVYVEFYSDESFTYKGFQMSVKADGPAFTTATLTSSPRTLTTSTTATTGQHTVKNVAFSDTLFSSPGYVDSLNYGINTTRDYRFSTYPNYTMILTVVEFVLESADKNSNCAYDRVTLYDGYDDTAPVLNILCGSISPGTTYKTTGDTVYVVFYSDYSNTFKGFQMSVKADGPTFTTAALTSSPRTLTTSTTATTALPDNGLVCFGCEYTTALSYCDSIQSCKVNQMCFLQRARNPQGHNHYRSGCMDQQICYRHNQSDNGLSSETCLQCCTEHFCNSHGCGDHGFPPKESRGPICLDCAYASHPNECDRVTICSQEQSCHIEELQWGDVSIFHLGCKSIHECAFETRSVTDMNDASTAGKDALSQRSVPLCKACCQDDFCNRNCTRSGSNNQLEIVG